MQEYVDLMIFKDGKPSQFYQTYVKEIQKIIQENAAMEFACIWAEHSKHDGTKARTVISDELSSTLNNLQAKLEGSDLYDDASTRQAVMKRAFPKTLIDQVGLETLLKRVPEAHQRALFSSWIAAHFVRLSVLWFLSTWLIDGPLGLQVRCICQCCRLFPFCEGSHQGIVTVVAG